MFFGGGITNLQTNSNAGIEKNTNRWNYGTKEIQKNASPASQSLGFGLRYFSAFKFLLDLIPLIMCVIVTGIYIHKNELVNYV